MFGLQKNMKMLVYSELKRTVAQLCNSSIQKITKDVNLILEILKQQLPKYPGTNNIAYELVYADIIDVRDPNKNDTRKSLKIKTQSTIKITQTQIEVTDDPTKLNVGGLAYTIFVLSKFIKICSGVGTSLEIFARTGRLLVDVPNGELKIDMQSGPDLVVGTVEQINGDLRSDPKIRDKS